MSEPISDKNADVMEAPNNNDNIIVDDCSDNPFHKEVTKTVRNDAGSWIDSPEPDGGKEYFRGKSVGFHYSTDDYRVVIPIIGFVTLILLVVGIILMVKCDEWYFGAFFILCALGFPIHYLTDKEFCARVRAQREYLKNQKKTKQ